MELIPFLIVLNVLSVLPLAHAWTFVWRNASDNAFVEHSNAAMPCTKINHAQGMLFEWDSEEGDFAISLYGNSDCSGPPGGYATHLFNKKASKPIDSFKVDSTATTTTSASMTTPTTSKASSTTTSTDQSQSQSPTATNAASSPSGSGLSGGAIAGIVIGVIAGVALIGGALYLIGRRNNQKPPGSSDTGVTMGYAAPPYGSPATYTSPSSFGPGLASLETKNQAPSSTTGSSNNPVRVVELQGNSPAAELSDSHAVNELESHARSPISPP